MSCSFDNLFANNKRWTDMQVICNITIVVLQFIYMYKQFSLNQLNNGMAIFQRGPLNGSVECKGQRGMKKSLFNKKSVFCR